MKKKIMFLALQELPPCNGISKKIIAQNNAFKNNGYHSDLCYIETIDDNSKLIKVEDQLIYTMSNGITRKLKRGCMFSSIEKYMLNNGYSIIYIRYLHFADFFFVNFLRRLKKNGIKVLIEIPTYPYDSEYTKSSLLVRSRHMLEKWFRKDLKYVCDYIVTFSNDKQIFGIPAINISNAVEKETILLRNPRKRVKFVNLLGVAQISFWHGFDRLIKGLAEYYKQGNSFPVHFNIVGNGNIQTIEYLKNLTDNLELSEYVHFFGPKTGHELDVLFNEADLAVGCLACHRKRIKEVKSLKNVEYAMRGIPFVYSENNDDFDSKNYILKVPNDESNIDINQLLNFIFNNKFEPIDIRNSVKELTWNNQMKNVLKNL